MNYKEKTMKSVSRILCAALLCAITCLSLAMFAACSHEHKWDEGKITTPPTCTQEGEKTYTCEDCGKTKTEKIPATGHDWDYDNAVITKQPTYSHEGSKTVMCLNTCGETKTEPIAKLPFTPNANVNSGEKIQEAIDRAEAGDIIFIKEGTYKEQLIIDKDLTIIGENNVTIGGPEDYMKMKALTAIGGESTNYSGIIMIENCTVTIDNITVKGCIESASGVNNLTHANRYIGVAAVNATVNLDYVNIKDIRYDDSLFGMQNGIGLYAVAEDEGKTVTLRYSDIANFNKGAAVIRAGVSEFICEGNTVTGAGEQGITAQNGLQVACKATITGNTLKNMKYSPEPATDWAHSSYALYIQTAQEDSVSIENNIIDNCDNGIYIAVKGSCEISGNQFKNLAATGEEVYEETDAE